MSNDKDVLKGASVTGAAENRSAVRAVVSGNIQGGAVPVDAAVWPSGGRIAPGDAASTLRSDVPLTQGECDRLLAAYGEWLTAKGKRQSGAPVKMLQDDIERKNFSGLDLSGKNLSGADLRGADLRGQHFNGALWFAAIKSAMHLRGVHLTGAILSDLDFTGEDFTRVDLRGTKGLTQAQLDSAFTDSHTLVSLPLKLKVHPKPRP